MNVALTRARKAVIIVGNKATLKMGKADEESTAVWRRLLGSCVEVKIGA
jgi:superfamily I DNA and/or RNA helicase